MERHGKASKLEDGVVVNCFGHDVCVTRRLASDGQDCVYRHKRVGDAIAST